MQLMLCERMEQLHAERENKFPALKQKRTEAIHNTEEASAVTLPLHQ